MYHVLATTYIARDVVKSIHLNREIMVRKYQTNLSLAYHPPNKLETRTSPYRIDSTV